MRLLLCMFMAVTAVSALVFGGLIALQLPAGPLDYAKSAALIALGLSVGFVFVRGAFLAPRDDINTFRTSRNF